MAEDLANPTVILVHGAWADGSSWAKVVLPLQAQGFNLVAAQLPLTSLSDDVASLERLLRHVGTSTLLVGHSYGGAVTTVAAAGNPQVKGLVYVAAIVPDQGETVGQIFGRVGRDPRAPALHPDEAGLLWVTGDAFRGAISPDASAADINMMAAAQKPISIQCLCEPLKEAGWHEKPSWFLIAEKDLMVPPATQRFTAQRMRAKISSIAVDHSPMLSRPDAVIDLVCEAAGALRAGGGFASAQAIETTQAGQNS